MSLIVQYRLPPRVKVVPNPHWTGGDTSYAPYTLECLGAYPLGVYSILSNTSFGGDYEVTETTNCSITVKYRGRMPSYPNKVATDIVDINEYEFAHSTYDPRPDLYVGKSNERQHHPFVFDFSEDNSAGVERLSQEIKIELSSGYIPNYYNKRLPGTIYRPGDNFPGGLMTDYGFASAYFEDMPGFQEDTIEDPTGLGLLPIEFRTGMKGRYLIVTKAAEGFYGEMPVMIYPQFPNDRNATVFIESFGPIPSIIDGNRYHSGVILGFEWNSLYRAATGPCFGHILPYRKKYTSNTMPMLIKLPEDADPGDLMISKTNTSKPFDFKGFEVERDPEWLSNYLDVGTVVANRMS
jgi:hypothetical protein